MPSRKKWVKFKNTENIKSKLTYLGNCHKNFSWGLISWKWWQEQDQDPANIYSS